MKSKVFKSMTTMFMVSIIFCMSSCGIDKSKCTSDYVYYKRVCKMYSEVFDKLDENQSPDADAIVKKYACKELKNAIKEYVKHEKEYGGSNGVFISYMGMFDENAKYSHDGGDPFIGTDEEIYNIAKTGEKFNVPFQFCLEKERKTDIWMVNVVLIYEDGDWKVYNFIDHRNNDLQEYLKARKEVWPERYR